EIDGVPSRLVTKSMYQPDGRSPGAEGSSKSSVLPCWVKLTATERCSTSVTCVTALGRISRIEAIGVASTVLTDADAPRQSSVGAFEMVGRRPRYRYGGE